MVGLMLVLSIKIRPKKKPHFLGLSYSGGGIRTRDLRVMSPTSYQTAPPRGGQKILATSGVVALWANSGGSAWNASTGSYVYSSPAAADVPGLGPTVYLGSYDGTLYAYNALSGGVRWSHGAGGRIDGSATVLGNVVYYSGLGTNTTEGLNLRTGRQVFSFPDGEFSPVITDGKAVFLIGYSTIYQMLPRR
jgi:outer membrane protein assembly factor BamB